MATQDQIDECLQRFDIMRIHTREELYSHCEKLASALLAKERLHMDCLDVAEHIRDILDGCD